jgi:hypothetical protein
MARSSETNQGDEGVVAKVVNVAKIRATIHEPTLLHFTSEQWKHAVERVKRVDKLLENHLVLEVAPMPGKPGIMLAATLCPPDCKPIYEYSGSTPKDFTRILAGCDCGPPPLPVTPPPSRCRLAMEFASGDTRLPSLICVDRVDGKRCLDAEPGVVARSDGVYILGCSPR